MIRLQALQPSQGNGVRPPAPGTGGDAAQPGRASAGRCGGSCVAMTGRGRPETLTLRGEKADL